MGRISIQKRNFVSNNDDGSTDADEMFPFIEDARTKDQEDDHYDGAKRSPPIVKSLSNISLPNVVNVSSSNNNNNTTNNKHTVVSSMGLAVLCLLAVQNCSKNLLMRFVMRDQPKFLTSAAVLGSECIKLSLSVAYILFVQRKSVGSIIKYLREDMRNTLLLIVPASAYNLQMSLEYVALANLDAAVFSVLVQTKLLCTAICAAMVLQKKLKYLQVISLVLLTTGVMLCNLKGSAADDEHAGSQTKGIMATLGIAASSGLASVYTEKVIKGGGNNSRSPKLSEEYGLAYTQVQLALMSLLTIGLYACAKDSQAIHEHGLFHNFTTAAFGSVLMSAVGGLIVASVLKYADSILKGYATALSVLLTGMLSQILFGTHLSTVYFMGMINVSVANHKLDLTALQVCPPCVHKVYLRTVIYFFLLAE